MRSRLSPSNLIAIITAAALFVPLPSSAQEGTAPAGTPVLHGRNHPLKGRQELMVNLGIGINNAFTSHYLFTATYAYHILDSLSLEATGGYVLGIHGSLGDDTLEGNDRTNVIGVKERITNGDDTREILSLNKLGVIGHANITWSPLYGKISLVTLYEVNLGLYLTGGGGVAGVKREIIITSPRNYDEPGAPDYKPAFNVGGGFEIYFNTPKSSFGKRIAFRLDIRDYFVQHEFTSQECMEGQLCTDGGGTLRVETHVDWNHFTFFTIGTRFLF